MRRHIIREQIILEIRAGSHSRIYSGNVPDFFCRFIPAVICIILICRIQRAVSVFKLMRYQLIDIFVSVLILDGCPPAEVVQSEIPDIHIFSVLKAQNFGKALFHADWHIADVDHSGIRAESSACFCYDGSRIGIVQHPAVRRIFLHIINILQNSCNGAHSICNASRPAGFLSHNTVFQRNLFIQLTHCEFSYTYMCQAKIYIRIRRLRVGRRQIFNRRIFFLHDNLTSLCHLVLAVFIIIIQLDRTQRELIKII